MQFSRKLHQKQRLPWLLRLIVCVVLAFLAGVFFLYFRQHSMLYHPRPYDESYATTLPRDGMELEFTTVAGKQVAFYLPRGNGQRFRKPIWIARARLDLARHARSTTGRRLSAHRLSRLRQERRLRHHRYDARRG